MANNNKTRFNFVDVLVILVILAIIGASVLLILNRDDLLNLGEEVPVEYVVRISKVKADYLPLIKEGETVKNSSDGKEIGTILSVKTEPSPVYGDTAISDGNNGLTVSLGEAEDSFDVYVTIKTDASRDQRGILSTDGIRLLVGSTVYFKIPSFTSVSFITSVKSN